MSDKKLSADVRALLKQIGLTEGADESTVLKQSKGKRMHLDDEADEAADVAALTNQLDSDDEVTTAKSKKKKPAVATQPTDKSSEVKSKPAIKPEAQKRVATADDRKQTQTSQPRKADAVTKTANAQDSPHVGANGRPVVSLSRPKEQSQPQQQRKSKSAAANEKSDAPTAEAIADVKPELPFSRPMPLPTIAPPSTVAPSFLHSNIKYWWQAAEKALPLPLSISDAAATAQAKTNKRSMPKHQGKRIKLSDAADDAASAGAAESQQSQPRTVDEAAEIAQKQFDALVKKFEQINYPSSAASNDDADATSGNSGSGDAAWLSSVLSKGTLSDRVAALTLLISEAPLYRLVAIDRLLAMCKKQGRRESGLAIEAAVDLFAHTLLPKHRKLKSFAAAAEKMISTHTATYSNLVYAYYEDQLKQRYVDLLSTLEVSTHDELVYIRKQRLQQVFTLLSTSPERERVLLAMAINKLGDRDRSVVSRVAYHLTTLLSTSPAFTLPIIEELQQLLYRSGMSARTQYVCLRFLSQIVLRKGVEGVDAEENEEVANTLVATYLAMFKQLLHAAKGEAEEEEKKRRKRQMRKLKREGKSTAHLSAATTPSSTSSSLTAAASAATDSARPSAALRSKLLSALLSGLNRALPYASKDIAQAHEQSQTQDDEGGKHGKNNKDGKSSSNVKGKGKASVLAHMDVLFALVHSDSVNTAVQALMLLWQVLSVGWVKPNGTGGSVDDDGDIEIAPASTTIASTTASKSSSSTADIMARSGGVSAARFYRALYDLLFTPSLLSASTKHALFLNLVYKSLLRWDPLESTCRHASLSIL